MNPKRILLIVSLLQLSKMAIAQKVSLSLNNVSLESVFAAIESQTNYTFWYKTKILRHTRVVSVNVKNADVRDVLDSCFKDQPIIYRIIKNTIYVKVRAKKTEEQTKQPSTDSNNKQETVKNDSAQLLDETVITAYGKTSPRFNTGAISKISGHDIGKQLVGNMLGALEGIPGLLSNQGSGFPGSPFDVQIRGQNSIGTLPGFLPQSNVLYIIDGVPFAPGNNSLTTIASNTALGGKGISPFATINPDDIERIEVLKDADATSLFGCRGSDGVILITTKQQKPCKAGKLGKPSLTVNIYTGISTPTTILTMLNTEQYIGMRREALKNDNLAATINIAPDLTVLDTTRYTNVKSMLLDETAKVVNGQVSVSGANNNTQYLLSAGYRRETTVFSECPGDQRTSLHFAGSHSSVNHRFSIQLSMLYGENINRSLLTDLTSALTLPPNIPLLHDSANNLVWQNQGIIFQNPLADQLQTYCAQTKNLISNIVVSYKLTGCLTAKASFGYNSVLFSECSIIPGRSLNPSIISDPTGSSFWGINKYINKIIEPRMEYSGSFKGGDVTGMVGSTWQAMTNKQSSINASGFVNDETLTDISTARNVINLEKPSIYRYEGVFGRLEYNWQNKYLLNLTGRRDGSSRFGPKKRFGNFWAIGAAWIFTSDSAIIKKFPFLNFGKLRGSYGSTGNDQIGDYQYLDRWNQAPLTYLGNNGIVPSQISDSSYSWEVTRKFEGALEIGVLKNRVNIIVDYFLNRTGNQLISQILPYATGFNNIAAKNSRAIVQNSGVEITLKSKNIIKKDVNWSTDVTVTFPRNQLLTFPGLADSRYSKIYTEGRSLTWNVGYKYLDVDPASGLFKFLDQDGDGKISYPNDYIQIGNLDPTFYGWFRNSFTFKNWVLDISAEYKKQRGNNVLFHIYNTGGPGTPMLNQPAIVLKRWQNTGDHAIFQRYTTNSSSEAAMGADNFLQSSGRFGDALRISLKNISLSYNFPGKWIKKMSVKNACLYLRAQNILVITSRNVYRQQIQTPYALPPLRTIAAGFQCSF